MPRAKFNEAKRGVALVWASVEAVECVKGSTKTRDNEFYDTEHRTSAQLALRASCAKVNRGTTCIYVQLI